MVFSFNINVRKMAFSILTWLKHSDDKRQIVNLLPKQATLAIIFVYIWSCFSELTGKPHRLRLSVRSLQCFARHVFVHLLRFGHFFWFIVKSFHFFFYNQMFMHSVLFWNSTSVSDFWLKKFLCSWWQLLSLCKKKYYQEFSLHLLYVKSAMRHTHSL